MNPFLSPPFLDAYDIRHTRDFVAVRRDTNATRASTLCYVLASGCSAVVLVLRQVVFASHVGRPKHKRAMIGGALDGDVFLGKKVSPPHACHIDAIALPRYATYRIPFAVQYLVNYTIPPSIGNSL